MVLLRLARVANDEVAPERRRWLALANVGDPVEEAPPVAPPTHPSQQRLRHVLQREIEADTLPWCIDNDVSVVIYWPLMKGLLAGRMARDHVFPADDGRHKYPMFQGDEFGRNLDFVDTPEQLPVAGAYMPHEEMSLFLTRLLDRNLEGVGIAPAPLKSKPAPFYILKRAAMPSMSMTLGFWSNPSDRLRMSESDYVELMAQNLKETLLLYSRLVGDMSQEAVR